MQYVTVNQWPLISCKLGLTTIKKSKYFEANQKNILGYAVENFFLR